VRKCLNTYKKDEFLVIFGNKRGNSDLYYSTLQKIQELAVPNASEVEVKVRLKWKI
jgi:hypothetical protein